MRSLKTICCVALAVFLFVVSCKSNSKKIENVVATRTIANDSIPKPIGFVNDFEGWFSKEEIHHLDSIIKQHEKQTSNQICIVTIDSSFCSSKDFDTFALQLHNAWGVGTKEKNNGVVICLSKQMRKARINNGRGIEAFLSNEETKKIIDTKMLPHFKEGNYYQGTLNGLLAILFWLEKK
jgi:uncharacterized protein